MNTMLVVFNLISREIAYEGIDHEDIMANTDLRLSHLIPAIVDLDTLRVYKYAVETDGYRLTEYVTQLRQV